MTTTTNTLACATCRATLPTALYGPPGGPYTCTRCATDPASHRARYLDCHTDWHDGWDLTCDQEVTTDARESTP